MFVHEYAQALKKAADALRDVDKPIAESEMVLALLAGADPRYNTTGEIIAGEAGMTFVKAVDRLSPGAAPSKSSQDVRLLRFGRLFFDWVRFLLPVCVVLDLHDAATPQLAVAAAGRA